MNLSYLGSYRTWDSTPRQCNNITCTLTIWRLAVVNVILLVYLLATGGTAPFEVTNPMTGVALEMTDVTVMTGRGRAGFGQPIKAWVAKIEAADGAPGDVTLRFSVLSTSESSK